MIDFQLFFLNVTIHTGPDLFLVYTGKKRTKNTVPDGKNPAKICIPLFQIHRVMNPMHGRRYKKNPVKALDLSGQLDSAVLEEKA